MAVHVERLRLRLRENSHRTAYFLLFLRIFPMSPNWAINVSCGVLDVPVSTFFGTVLIGLMPYNFICVQTGAILSSLSSVRDIFTWWNMMQLTVIAFVALLPGVIGKNPNVSPSHKGSSSLKQS